MRGNCHRWRGRRYRASEIGSAATRATGLDLWLVGDLGRSVCEWVVPLLRELHAENHPPYPAHIAKVSRCQLASICRCRPS